MFFPARARKYCRAVFLLLFVSALSLSSAAMGASEYVPVKEGEKAPVFEIQGFNSSGLIGKENLILVFYRGHY